MALLGPARPPASGATWARVTRSRPSVPVTTAPASTRMPARAHSARYRGAAPGRASTTAWIRVPARCRSSAAS
jgi:hypothetical protein